MQLVTNIALPGYNAQTDTNPDHFAVYANDDNVLIKRKLTGTAVIADGSPTILTVAHNLGYIPFFVVYYYDENNIVWSILDNQYDPFSVPQQICAVDTNNLYIYNFGGHPSGHVQVAYDIFYDNMNDNTAPVITESDKVYKVARPGVNALTSKNPNDYIVHSDLNNMKILKQGTGSLTISPGGFTGSTFAHGAGVIAPYKYFLFIKFPDGKTILTGNAGCFSYDETYGAISTAMDGTNFYFYNFGSSSVMVSISYVIYGTGQSGMITPSSYALAVAAPGKSVIGETNPDNFNFHSYFPTLKYFTSNVYSMTVSNTTVQVIPHNLGYVPFFIGFINDIGTIITNGYAVSPYYLGQSTIGTPNKDIAAFVYADATNLYLKEYYQANAVGTVKTFNFYYKIFKNNLGL